MKVKSHNSKVNGNKRATKIKKKNKLSQVRHSDTPKNKAKVKQLLMKNNTQENENENVIQETTSKKSSTTQKKVLTHQMLFLKSNKRRNKKPPADPAKEFAYNFNLTKPNKHLSLRDKMLQKLKAARFRYLNEQMYTNIGKDAKKYFDNDPNAYTAYHEGYRQQVAKWPLNPVDVIIRKIKKLPQNYIIADFGCGDAKLAASTSHTVYSFDLVAINERITTCDMSHVPLNDNSVNVVVFCLSLMGTNLKDYILEGRRVLKNKGLLLIAEVESRFEDVDVFIKNMRSYGFVNSAKDFSHNLFFFLDFVKQNNKAQSALLDLSLKPCLYKKR